MALKLQQLVRPPFGQELITALSPAARSDPRISELALKTGIPARRCGSVHEAEEQLKSVSASFSIVAVENLMPDDKELLVHSANCCMARARLEVLRQMAVAEYPDKVCQVSSVLGSKHAAMAELTPESDFLSIATAYGNLCHQAASGLALSTEGEIKKLLRRLLSIGTDDSPACTKVSTQYFLRVDVETLTSEEWSDAFISILRSSINSGSFGYGKDAAESLNILTKAAQSESEGPKPSYVMTQPVIAGLLFSGKLRAAYRNASKELGYSSIAPSRVKYRAARQALCTAPDSLKGIAGYKAFAASYSGHDMLKAYQLLSAVAEMEGQGNEFKALGWRCFFGSVAEYDIFNE